MLADASATRDLGGETQAGSVAAVQLVRFGSEYGREIDRFGSVGFRIAGLARVVEGRVACITLTAGGRIGRHAAVGRQVFAVVAGSGSVSGGDGVEHDIAAGTAAVWEAGEEHETRTNAGQTAIVVEGAGVEAEARP
jgi:quercetin dioxygenase-like cupin family protein